MSDKKIEKKPLVPRLRFPEFQNAGEWKVKALRDLATRTTKKNHDALQTRVLTNSAEFGVVDQRDFFDKDIANKDNLAGYYIVEKGDYVYNPRISATAPVGPISKNSLGTGVMSPLYTVFRFTKDNNEFYSYYFKTSKWHAYMRQESGTGARHDRMNISTEAFLLLPLPVISSQEQKKIADCLSSLDELINSECKNLDSLKTHKKGLMQQLFPSENKTTPRLRFSRNQGDKAWKQKTIGQIATLHKGKGIAKSDISPNGICPCIRYGELYTNYGAVIHKVVSKTSIEINNLFLSKSNDVLIPSSGETKIDIAKSSCILQDYVAIGGDVSIIRSNINGVFLSYYINGQLKLQISKFAQGDSVVHLYPDQIKNLQVLIPNIEEQQKIARCLSSIDELIDAQSRKIELLKLQKKGLMQQLFPEMDEVTA